MIESVSEVGCKSLRKTVDSRSATRKADKFRGNDKSQEQA